MKNPLNMRFSRDLCHNKGKYISIAIIMTLTIAFVSAFLAVTVGLEETVRTNQEECKLEDGGFRTYIPLTQWRKEKIEKSGITIYDQFYSECSIDDTITLRIYQLDDSINIPTLVEGKLPEGNQDIALDLQFAKTNQYEIGDVLSINNQKYYISGFVTLPNYSSLFKESTDVMMDALHFGVAVVSQKDFGYLYMKKVTYQYAYYFADRQLSKEEQTKLLDQIQDEIIEQGVQLSSFMTTSMNPCVTYLNKDMAIDVPIIQLYLCILTIIMAFVFALNIRHTIENESRIIGTLMASGYTKKELTIHYMILPCIVTLLSSLIGNIIAYTVMVDVLESIYHNIYSIPNFSIQFDVEAFLWTTILPVVVMVLINYSMTLLKFKYSTLDFLRRDIHKIHVKGPVRLPHVPFIHRFRMRVLIQNRSNFIILLLGTVLSSYLLLFGIGLIPCLHQYIDSVVESPIAQYEYKLNREYQVPGTNRAEAFLFVHLDASKDCDSSGNVGVYGIKEKSSYITQIQTTMEENEIYVTNGFLRKMNVNVGDTVCLNDDSSNVNHEFIIAGTCDYPGRVAVFLNMDYLTYIFNYPDGYYNGYFSDVELDIDKMFIGSVVTPEDLSRVGEQLLSSCESYVPFFIIITIFIYIMMAYMLTKQVIDKNRQTIADMKVFGYEECEIRRFYLDIIFFFVIVDLVISYPLAYRALTYSYECIFSKTGGYIEVYIPSYLFIEVLAIGLVSYVVVDLLHRRNMNKIIFSEYFKRIE